MIFPTNFLWGASTSAFQVEGGYNEGGKGVATTDLGARRPGIADNKVAADHYHHWKEDVDLMPDHAGRLGPVQPRGPGLL